PIWRPQVPARVAGGWPERGACREPDPCVGRESRAGASVVLPARPVQLPEPLEEVMTNPETVESVLAEMRALPTYSFDNPMGDSGVDVDYLRPLIDRLAAAHAREQADARRYRY